MDTGLSTLNLHDAIARVDDRSEHCKGSLNFEMDVHTQVGKYELDRVLGSGTFAKVRLARNVETGEDVAVKVLDKEKVLQYKMEEQIKREISTMRLVRHPNIVHLHEVLASRSKIYLVMEYLTGGGLFNKIVEKTMLPEDQARKYFQQLIDAVQYCHSCSVFHRNLKLENLLLDSKGNLKISNFGLSALPEQLRADGLLHTTCGSPNYVAPEVILSRGYDGGKADLWSCGVILFVLMAGRMPFYESNMCELYRKIFRAEFKFPTWFSAEARHFISHILQPDPALRVTFDQILEDPWFKQGYVPPKLYLEELIDTQDVENVFNLEHLVTESHHCKPLAINAFEFLSMSPGLDLSGLFEKQQEKPLKQEARFTFFAPVGEIITKIEEIVKPLGFLVYKQKFRLRLYASKKGKKGHLSVATEIFEVAPSVFILEFRKTGGDNLEYKSFYRSLSLGLKDMVWNWEASL